MKTIVLFAAFLFLAACADTARVNTSPQYASANLDRSASAYVAVSRDGSYGAENYTGSGRMLTQIIRSSLLMHMDRVQDASSRQNLTDALRSARSGGHKYLFFPSILHWEDRATEWSMKPDVVRVKIEVLDVASSSRVSAATINGQSGMATFGGDRPQDLLPKPVENYIRQLF